MVLEDPNLKQQIERFKSVVPVYNGKENELYYEFNESDTYLNAIFHPKIASIILRLLHSTIIQTLIVITTSIYMALGNIMPDKIYYPLYIIVMSLSLWIPYASLWLLCSNRLAFILINKSFEYWFKVIYGIIYGVTSVFLISRDDTTYFELLLVGRILIAICTILPVIVISSFDSVPMAKNWQIIVAGLYAVVFTTMAITLQIERYNKVDNSIVFVIDQRFGISLLQTKINAARIIAIFFWKQTVQTLMKKDSRCVLLRYAPYIKWYTLDPTKCVEKRVDDRYGNNVFTNNDQETPTQNIASSSNEIVNNKCIEINIEELILKEIKGSNRPSHVS